VALHALIGTAAHVEPAALARIVGSSVLLPLVVGMIARRLAPGLSSKAAGPLHTIAMLLLLAAFIPLFMKEIGRAACRERRGHVTGVQTCALPISVALHALIGTAAHVEPAALARIVGSSVLLPLVVGMIARRLAPGLSSKAAGPLHTIAMLLLLAAFIPLFMK